MTDSKKPAVSLRLKWSLALLVVALSSVGALAVLSLRIQRIGLATAERSLQISVIDQVREATERALDDAAESTRRTGNVLTEGRIADDAVRLELAGEAVARALDLSAVAVYGPEGEFVDAITRRGSEVQIAPLERLPAAVLTARPAEGEWLEPDATANGLAFRFVQPMVREGELRAWVVGTLPAIALSRRVRTISAAQFGSPDRALVIDESMRVIAGGSEQSGSAQLSLRDLVGALRLPSGGFHRNLGATTEFTAADGTPTIGTLRTLPSRGWAIGVRRPEREAYAALASSRRAFAIAAIVVAIVAIVFGTYLAARTTRPVADLIDLSHAYARRDFARRSSVRTGDELQILGDSLGDMAGALQASEAEITRRAKVESNLSRFLPATVAAHIATGEKALALGGERRAVSVLFADVVSFTTFAERAAPEKVVEFLNELFTVLTEVVFRHEGTVDKFMGDSLMAIWGAPDAVNDHAARALAAAEDMHRFVESSAPGWKETYGVDVQLAIGVSSGEAVVGNLGSETRMEYTAIGDVVNIAARLESLARPGRTLVTAETARVAGDAFAFTSLGTHPLRGKSTEVEVMEMQ